MQNYNDIQELLQILESPAFAVDQGEIIFVNDKAQQRQITVGMPIESLFVTGKEAYAAFTDGRLHLQISVADTVWDACVTKTMGLDIFQMDRHISEPELRTLSLAAMQLRSPLNEIMALSERLLSDEDSETKAKFQRSLMAMQRLVGNMADAPRYNRNHVCVMQTQNVTAFFCEIMEKATQLLEQAGYHLTYFAPKGNIFSLVSAERLERAIYNLLSNAIKFSPVGSAITAKLEHCGETLLITIEDEGEGLATAPSGNIFARYLREPTLEDSRHGMGLGLSYVCSAASAHKGTVLIRQPEGKGLSVTMTLAIRHKRPGTLSSNPLMVDYSGGQDHALLELSECLPHTLYKK